MEDQEYERFSHKATWLLPVCTKLSPTNCKQQFLVDLDKVFPGVQDDIKNNINGGSNLLESLVSNILIGAYSCEELSNRCDQMELQIKKLTQRPDLS